jgi:hypothetical protein
MEKIPIGTKIKFLKDLTERANEDHPDIIFAEKDDTGEIISYDAWEGYLVKWDKWDAPFGAQLNIDFEIL